MEATQTQPKAGARVCARGAAAVGVLALIGGVGLAIALRPRSAGGSSGGPQRVMQQEEANAVALANPPNAVVSGQRFIWFGLGDWGRCGSPTTNPVTRAARCNSQLSYVPSMEAYAAQLQPGFIMSVGDQFYDGPMSPSGARDMNIPASAAELAQADADPIYSLSFRNIYNTPTLRNTEWHLFQGNHDYGGLLASQVNFGTRNTGQPGDDGFDRRWIAPDVNFTRQYTMSMGGGTPGPRDCVSFVYIDTCPLMDTYRASSGDRSDPNRRATTGLREVFQKQINIIPNNWEQMAWFRDQLYSASQACRAVVVGGHHAIYSSGQHARSPRQQDLKTRLNLPGAFAWAGVDAFMNGHEHIIEYLEANGTAYIVTGAGSDVRTNNILVPESQYLLEDNGFTVHSANSTHMMHSLIRWDGVIVYQRVLPLLSKQADAPTPIPSVPSLNWLQPGFTP